MMVTSTTSFVKRQITVEFTLGEGSFGNSGSNTITLSGLRCLADIEMPGGTLPGVATLRIFGMDPSHMAQLSSLKVPYYGERRNGVTITAGDTDSGMGIVFTGRIDAAWIDANAAPNAAFTVTGRAGDLGQLVPVPPSSYPGPVDAAVILSTLAQIWGIDFENNGVSFIFPGPVYLPGTVMDQINRLRTMVPFEIIVDPSSSVLAIWPRGGSRNKPVILISPETGLVGYPTYATAGGIAIKSIFNRNLFYGSNIRLQSSIANAAGDWTIYRLTHNLESENPRGAWFTSIECLYPGIQ